IVRTSSVFAVPGRPVIRQLPPTNRPIRTCSITSSWPTITRRTCRTISPSTSRNRAMRDFKTSGSSWAVVVDMSSFLFFSIAAQFEQQLLGRLEIRRGFQCCNGFLSGLIFLARGLKGPCKIVMAARRIYRMHRDQSLIFEYRTLRVAGFQQHSTEAFMQLRVLGKDEVQPLKCGFRFLQFPGVLEQLRILFQRVRIAPADL